MHMILNMMFPMFIEGKNVPKISYVPKIHSAFLIGQWRTFFLWGGGGGEQGDALNMHCWAWTFLYKQGLLSSCSAWASPCGGFSSCGARAPGTQGLSSCTAQLSCQMACGIFQHQGSTPCPLH